MKYCTNCGAKLEDDYKVCPNCGQKVEASAPVTPESVAAETPFFDDDATSYGFFEDEPAKDDMDNFYNDINREVRPQPQHYNHKVVETSPVFAILALVFGILGVVVPGFVFSIIGLKKYTSGPHRNMCIAGLVLSIVWTIIIIILYIVYFSAIVSGALYEGLV